MAELEEKIHEVLTRSVSAIYPSREVLEKVLFSGRKLKVYLGVDPTGPHLHLGHLTNLLVLKRLQNLGHEIIFLVGDFTARIGDPTDKMAPRQELTEEEVERNMRTFKEQASRIISFSGRNQAKIRFNSEWYEKMTLKFFISYLLAAFSVQNLFARKEFIKRVFEKKEKSLAKEWVGAFVKSIFGEENKSLQHLFIRKDFARRIIESKPIQLQEFIYPLLQGWDGVELDVDIEIGGNDQVFNMSVGRAFRAAQSREGAKPKTKDGEKFFIATKLLEHPKTGKKLMNKSEGGMINLDDTPEDIFGKVMALDDVSMFPVAEFCTEMSLENVEKLRKLNPRDAKLDIAEVVVKTIYSEKAAAAAREKFIEVFSKKEMPADLPTLKLTGKGLTVISVIMAAGLAKSRGEARRLVEQGAVEIDGAVKKDANEILSLRGSEVVKIGKRHFFRVKI